MNLMPNARSTLAMLAGALAAIALLQAAPARADEGQDEASPPGILVDPPQKTPGGPQDDEEGDETPGPPGGLGCPVNKRPLELLV